MHPPSGFTSLLDGWKQQSNQYADNGDDDQEFDESET
ncbi:hypothetical protein DSM3645_00395 [Blastopirellula marina DSM 3645]|uniref:Uncharacterized protein n=1 Tax=Blastopirellula marina DSM 3645 TaxID=314230 RepID=A3ZMF4_9BACT|nr:hypothetical protein DSM3645_00395 [Blastopirellula marina DSM 3645]